MLNPHAEFTADLRSHEQLDEEFKHNSPNGFTAVFRKAVRVAPRSAATHALDNHRVQDVIIDDKPACDGESEVISKSVQSRNSRRNRYTVLLKKFRYSRDTFSAIAHRSIVCGFLKSPSSE